MQIRTTFRLQVLCHLFPHESEDDLYNEKSEDSRPCAVDYICDSCYSNDIYTGNYICNSFAFNEITLWCFADQSLLREVIF